MGRLHFARTAALLAALICACGDDAPSFDANLRPDAGSAPQDASVGLDAGLPRDAAGGNPACDPLDGTGCPSLRVCAYEDGGPVCSPLPADPLGLGAPCDEGRCGTGLVCATTSPVAPATCFQLCALDTGDGCEQLGQEFECRLRLDTSRYGACLRLPVLCNPFTRKPCDGDDQACQPFLRRSGAREFRCQPAGSVEPGEACGPRAGTCVSGSACVGEPNGRSAVCRRYCEVNADCPAPQQCTGIVDEPPFGYCQS